MFSNVQIVVPLGFFVFVLLAIFIPIYFNYKRRAVIQESVKLCLEKGVEIPPELFIEPEENLYKKFLHRGIILFFIGISTVPMFMKLVKDDPVWTIGLIPSVIGIGYILSAFIFKEKSED